jgi:hypothetical protein
VAIATMGPSPNPTEVTMTSARPTLPDALLEWLAALAEAC